MDGPKYWRTDRLFRHKCTEEKPEVLLREDPFAYDPRLKLGADSKEQTSNRVFMKLRMGDLSLL